MGRLVGRCSLLAPARTDGERMVYEEHRPGTTGTATTASTGIQAPGQKEREEGIYLPPILGAGVASLAYIGGV